MRLEERIFAWRKTSVTIEGLYCLRLTVDIELVHLKTDAFVERIPGEETSGEFALEFITVGVEEPSEFSFIELPSFTVAFIIHILLPESKCCRLARGAEISRLL